MQEKNPAGGTRRRVPLPPLYIPVQLVGAAFGLLALYLFRANGPSPLTMEFPVLGEPWVPWGSAVACGVIVLANGWRLIKTARKGNAAPG